MKKFIVLVALVLLSAPAFAQVSGSPHDFSSWTATGELCVPCHTPHNADTTVSDAPLWNHEVSAGGFNMYTSSSLDNGIAGDAESRSLLCLSCHDGATNLDAYGGGAGTDVLGSVTFPANNAGAVLGTDLSDDHPISINIVDNADAGIELLANITLPLYAGTVGNNQVECASCHDVHGEGAGDTTNGTGFLRLTQTGSALCLDCHIK